MYTKGGAPGTSRTKRWAFPSARCFRSPSAGGGKEHGFPNRVSAMPPSRNRVKPRKCRLKAERVVSPGAPEDWRNRPAGDNESSSSSPLREYKP